MVWKLIEERGDLAELIRNLWFFSKNKKTLGKISKLDIHIFCEIRGNFFIILRQISDEYLRWVWNLDDSQLFIFLKPKIIPGKMKMFIVTNQKIHRLSWLLTLTRGWFIVSRLLAFLSDNFLVDSTEITRVMFRNCTISWALENANENVFQQTSDTHFRIHKTFLFIFIPCRWIQIIFIARRQSLMTHWAWKPFNYKWTYCGEV